MFKGLKKKMLAVKVGALLEELNKAETVLEKAMIYSKANALKSECAMKLIMGEITVETYDKIFMPDKADAQHHFLDLLLEDFKAQGII